MVPIEFIYMIASASAVFAMAPQIKKLLQTKNSDELSMTTWFIWGVVQVVSLIYSIYLIALPFIIVNIFWVAFYFTMVVLIFKYRPRNELARQESENSANF